MLCRLLFGTWSEKLELRNTSCAAETLNGTAAQLYPVNLFASSFRCHRPEILEMGWTDNKTKQNEGPPSK
jgi:hypothetical protein